jgi:hypothetical protein
MMRYCYHNLAYRKAQEILKDPLHGIFCNPVRRADDRCIIGSGKQLVRFQDGAVCTVIQRALRLQSKCREHKGVFPENVEIQTDML